MQKITKSDIAAANTLNRQHEHTARDFVRSNQVESGSFYNKWIFSGRIFLETTAKLNF